MRSTKPRAVRAALVLTIVGAVLAPVSPAQAARPLCEGKRATIVGRRGNDKLVGTKRGDVIVAKGGNDIVDGRGGKDVICGGGGNDRLFGGFGNDRVFGEDGDNTLEGGPGNDQLVGGSGVDTASFATSPTGVTADLSTGQATGDGTDSMTGIENLSGSRHGDLLTGDDLSNGLRGGKGEDDIRGNGGDDVQQGNDGNDDLRGGIGTDSHYGGPGDDFSDGGDGDDAVAFKFSPAPVSVDVPIQTATGGEGTDTWSNMEIVVGSEHGDTFTGGTSNDYFYPLGGDDRIDGGPGTDVLDYSQSPARIVANLAQGTIAGEGNDQVVGVEGIVGSLFDDDLTGNSGNNFLWGLDGNDRIQAAEGDDFIDGGSGTDTCLQGESVVACEQ